MDSIPQGYKASSLGIIPNEWNIVPLGKLVSIISGESPSLYNLKSHGKYPYVKVEDMNNCQKYQRASREYSDDGRNLIKTNSVIFPKRGAAISNNKVRIAGCDLYMDSNMMAIIPNKYIESEFLYYMIVFKQLHRIADTSTIPQINNKHIIPYKICLPSPKEQKKIAEILSEWDKAIELQTKIIEQLEMRKRALMQRLLTGRVRLDGYSDKWETKYLRELFIERNETEKSYLPLLSITADKGVILQSELDKRDNSNEDKSKYKRICPNDIGYNTMRMWQGRSALSDIEGIVSPAYTVVTPNTEVDPIFIIHILQQPRTVYDFWTHSQGLADDTLNCKFPNFSQVKVSIPTLKEQTAIANVLVTVEKEIEIAKAKLSSLHNQKTGVMQQLLTGKKRI